LLSSPGVIINRRQLQLVYIALGKAGNVVIKSPEFAAKFHREVSLFLEISQFPQNTAAKGSFISKQA